MPLSIPPTSYRNQVIGLFVLRTTLITLTEETEAFLRRFFSVFPFIIYQLLKRVSYCFSMIGLSVVFSGPGRTADDVISRDSSWIMR